MVMDNERLYLLKLAPRSEPVFFVVKQQAMDDEHAKYFFEEHGCPANFIECEAIVADGDTDPHGLFEFVRSCPEPDDLDDVNTLDELWHRLAGEVSSDEPAA